jgi:hypothetical protein
MGREMAAPVFDQMFIRVVICVFLLGVVVPGLLRADDSRLATTADEEQRATELVLMLGSDEFAARERALDELVQLGPAALTALEDGLQSADREIRFRCRYALKIVRVLDFRRRLAAFGAGADAGESYALPGWEPFRDQFGDTSDARRLFVQMQERERILLQVLAESPTDLGETILQRVAQLRQSVGVNSTTLNARPDQVPIGTVAALLFASNCCTTELPREASDYLSGYLRGSSFSQAIRSGGQRDLLRKLLGTWIENCRGWSAFQGMLLALQYNMAEGLTAAVRIFEEPPGQPVEPLIRSYALLTIAKFGDENNLPLVESLLEDATPFGAAIPINGKGKFQTQIREVALATAIRLANEDYSKFGFERLQPHSFYVFNTSTIGFDSDAKRQAAIQKWRDFRKQSP